MLGIVHGRVRVCGRIDKRHRVHLHARLLQHRYLGNLHGVHRGQVWRNFGFDNSILHQLVCGGILQHW
jgi:hypothetical protein